MSKQSSVALSKLREALALDAAGKERLAVPLYRRALTIGLSGENLHTALVCLGSSLRTIGETQAAIRTLQKARRLFPRDAAVILFLALAHCDAGQTHLAIRQLADGLIKESPQPRLAAYRRTLARKYHAVRR
jgi:chloramphenicol O-acetyltransferase type A